MKKLFYISILTLPQIGLAQININIRNPLQSQSFGDLVIRISELIRQVALPFAAVAIIVIGFKIITSVASGNAEETAKNKKILIWVLVGAAIIAGAPELAKAIVNFASKL